MISPVDDETRQSISNKLDCLQKLLPGDIIFFYGQISNGLENVFRGLIEKLKEKSPSEGVLNIIWTTLGGSAEAVERTVNVIRRHYREVNFIIPDYAYSAGTIFCMSGDRIFMDYYSVLGPIDPQVLNKDGKWVAALGYLDKVNEMIEKSKLNELSGAEFMIFKDLDLAELRAYEQAKALTIDLLKRWLVQYKFKNWEKHNTTPELVGQEVTLKQKIERAEEIADKLSDNKLWKSHGRPLNINRLRDELRLQIEDFGADKELYDCIRNYFDHIKDYVERNDCRYCFHTREEWFL